MSYFIHSYHTLIKGIQYNITFETYVYDDFTPGGKNGTVERFEMHVNTTHNPSIPNGLDHIAKRDIESTRRSQWQRSSMARRKHGTRHSARCLSATHTTTTGTVPDSHVGAGPHINGRPCTRHFRSIRAWRRRNATRAWRCASPTRAATRHGGRL